MPAVSAALPYSLSPFSSLTVGAVLSKSNPILKANFETPVLEMLAIPDAFRAISKYTSRVMPLMATSEINLVVPIWSKSAVPIAVFEAGEADTTVR